MGFTEVEKQEMRRAASRKFQKERHKNYQRVVWGFTKTLIKFGYEIQSPLTTGYTKFAYRYGVCGGRR